MAKLTSSARASLPTSDFAVKGRKYPINDPNRARNALARVSQHGDAMEKKEVRAKVHAKFPSIGKSRESKGLSHNDWERMDHGGKHDHMKGRR